MGPQSFAGHLSFGQSQSEKSCKDVQIMCGVRVLKIPTQMIRKKVLDLVYDRNRFGIGFRPNFGLAEMKNALSVSAEMKKTLSVAPSLHLVHRLTIL